METLPNHSLVPTRLPPLGERALASHPKGHRIEVVPATPRGHPGLPVQGRQFEAVRQPKGLAMDTWKFYDITHREHVVCNPTSEGKLARLLDLLRLPAQARVVDIACGKGEFLIRLAEAYGIRGIGIDISPFCIADAQRQLHMRAQGAEVVFRQMNGTDFRPEEPRILTLASCIGA